MNQTRARPIRAANTLRISAIVALALFCGGCELIPLATLGAVFDIAGATAQVGPAIYHQGKLDIAFMARYADVQNAVRSAAADLRLHVLRDGQAGKADNVWNFQLQDDLKSNISVTIERRSPMLCRCRVNVGYFGSEPTARLVMKRIVSHLPSTHSAASQPSTAASDASPG